MDRCESAGLKKRSGSSSRRSNPLVLAFQRHNMARSRPGGAPNEQYQHFIPRFILRRFQVGPVKYVFKARSNPCPWTRILNYNLCRSKKERQKEFRLTGVDPEYVHYYDIATGSLDIRPIGQVYGIWNFYQDIRNTEDINELEKKLADLERRAASVINNMHKALPCGTFTLKRRDLELLRKFLFIMHYRTVSCSNHYFQADHPENAKGRQWIECLMKAKGIQSAVEAWLHFLRYYLDTSHSGIMQDAAELLEKYGHEGLQRVITESYIPPDLERFPAVAYYAQADGNFLSIWEAAEGEEFILTHNSFGLWEGLAGDCYGLHYIFVVSPRIAIVLRNVLLRPERKGRVELGPLKSFLLHVDPVPATPIYASGEDGMRATVTSPSSVARYRSSEEGANDTFVFKFTKLSRPQNLELNSVLLVNVDETGSLTFLSRETMLRTARAFRSLPRHLPKSDLLVPLIDCLASRTETESSTPFSSQSPPAPPDEDIDALSLVDVVLYVLLMQICTGRKQFSSAYDRAHLVFKVVENAESTAFAHEISREVEKAYLACEIDLEDSNAVGHSLDGVSMAPLLSSIPNELSCQLFEFMTPYMSKLGAVISGDEDILEQLQDEVVVVGFLVRASCSPGVWHTLSCSNRAAPDILSRLFKKFGTPADTLVKTFTDFQYRKASSSDVTSCYDTAYMLRKVCGMTGPTTNPISKKYYMLTTAMINVSGYIAMLGSLPAPYSSQSRSRPKARLVRNISKSHSDLLMSNMKMILQRTGFTPSSEEEDTKAKAIQKWIDEMAIVNVLAWLGKYRRNYLNFILDGFMSEMGFKLFEDEDEDEGGNDHVVQ